MSMMHVPNEDDEFKAQTDLLTAKAAELDDAARKLGLYVEEAHVVPIPTPSGQMQPSLMVGMAVGDLAFDDRVQNPERYSTDQQFRELEAAAQDDNFLDARNKIKENLAAGRDALDDGDE